MAETKEELTRKEREWVIKLDSLHPKGYNQTQDMASNPSQEQLDKILKVEESELKGLSNKECVELVGVSMEHWGKRNIAYKTHLLYKKGYEVARVYKEGRCVFYDLKQTKDSIIASRIYDLVGEKADVEKFLELAALFQRVSGLTAKEAGEKMNISEATFYRYRQLMQSL